MDIADISKSQAQSQTQDDVTIADGHAFDWPAGAARAYVTTVNSDVSCRGGTVSDTDGKSVVTRNDRELTHAAFAPGDRTVGNYLRGLTSGAVGVILELVDSTHTRITITNGIEFGVETVNETTDGTAGGDTGDSAAVSAVAKPDHDAVVINNNAKTKVFGRAVTDTKLLVRPSESDADVTVEFR